MKPGWTQEERDEIAGKMAACACDLDDCSQLLVARITTEGKLSWFSREPDGGPFGLVTLMGMVQAIADVTREDVLNNTKNAEGENDD